MSVFYDITLLKFDHEANKDAKKKIVDCAFLHGGVDKCKGLPIKMASMAGRSNLGNKLPVRQ